MPTLRRLPGWVDALWLVCLAFYMSAGAASVPFHGDESTLMVMGRDFHYIFVEGDLAKVLYDETWQVNPHEQHLRLLNGTVSKMVYGWLQWLKGFGPQDLNRNWNWGRGYDANAARGALPDGELLRRTRLASTLQLALAAAVFFQCVKMALDRPTAFLASGLFALHPNMLINGRRAMMEGSHILGLMLLLLAAIWLLRDRRWERYVLLGVCAGFAVAAKHSNLIVCALVFLACAREPIWRLLQSRGLAWRAPAAQLVKCAAAGAISVFLFLLLNPAWWRAPLETAQLTVELRQGLLHDQVDIFGGYNSFAEQAAGFFQYVFVGERQYYEASDWASFDPVSAQIADYEGSWLAGLTIIGNSGRLGLIYLLLTFLGGLRLARDKSVLPEARWLLLIWAIGAALTTLWLTPLPWARYYLPLLPALILFLSYSLVRFAGALIQDPYAKADGFALLD